jgi:peptidoglycan hydrolase CwlO-like protein
MELTAAHAMQGLMLIATIAGGYAVVKSQLSRVMEDLEEHIKRTEDHKTKFDARLDDAESQRAVFTSQIKTLAQINSVSELAGQNREMGELQARLKIAETHIAKLQDIHNGTHPVVKE